MTQAVNRGRGRPKAFDDIELAERVVDVGDLIRIRDALKANGETDRFARGAAYFVGAVAEGDPTGGVSRPTATSYRAALARLQHDPLGPKGRSARIAKRSQRGRAHLGLVAAAIRQSKPRSRHSCWMRRWWRPMG